MIELKEHNIRPFKEVTKALSNHEKTIYVAATGAGKTYVTMAVIEKLLPSLSEGVLIIVPNTHLKDKWKEAISPYEDLIEIETYQKICRSSFSIDKCSLLILDECHHIGAPKWGKGINRIINSHPNMLVLGLTATPIRCNDNGKNVSDYFDTEITGIDFIEGIEKGYLQGFEYISMLYGLKEYIVNLKKSIIDKDKNMDKLLYKLDLFENSHKIKEIILKHLPRDKRKIIVFSPTVKKLYEIKSIVDPIFKDADSYTISYENTKKYNKKQIKAFEKSSADISILYNINMLAEGAHIKGVNTLIMLRSTRSPNVFYQQLGRVVCAMKDNSQHMVFDFFGNAKKLEVQENKLAKYIMGGSKRVKNNKLKSSRKSAIITYDYATDASDILNEIKNVLLNEWTKEEDEILKKYYPIEGRKCFKRLPNRTECACANRCRNLNLSAPNKWTKEEDDILKKYYPIEGKKCFKRLPNRTKYGCINRCSNLNLSAPNKWTKEEVDILKKYYPLEGMKCFKRLPNRTESVCCARCSRLNLNSPNKWTKEEDDILKKYYPIEGKKCFKRLSNRTERACATRCSNLNLNAPSSKWTKEEDDILKKYYPIEGKKCFKRLPNRTESVCCARCSRLNLNSPNKWTKEEVDILKKYYPLEGMKCFKRLPNRTEGACVNRCNKLNLNSPNKWTKEEVDILKKYYPLEGKKCFKRLPNRTDRGCIARCSRLNLDAPKY